MPITVSLPVRITPSHRRMPVTLAAMLLSTTAAFAASPETARQEVAEQDRKHGLSAIDILGDGTVKTPFVLVEPPPARMDLVPLDRSFTAETLEYRDRETIEAQHDENG